MMAIPTAMSYYLDRKYAIQQQQADASTANSETQRIATSAAANLDKVKAALMPAESKANIGLTNANARLSGVQADYLPTQIISQAQRDISAAGLTDAQAETERLGNVADLTVATPYDSSSVQGTLNDLVNRATQVTRRSQPRSPVARATSALDIPSISGLSGPTTEERGVRVFRGGR
jgi:hypothetical protein